MVKITCPAGSGGIGSPRKYIPLTTNATIGLLVLPFMGLQYALVVKSIAYVNKGDHERVNMFVARPASFHHERRLILAWMCRKIGEIKESEGETVQLFCFVYDL